MVEIFTGLQPIEPHERDTARMLERIRMIEAAESVDRVLIGYSAIWPHNHATIPFLLAQTERVAPIIAHRPGVMSPTTTARYLATLDVLAGGRLATNIVVGGSDKDLLREGDSLPKHERYRRATEYLDVVRKTWTSADPFDHHGEYFDVEQVSIAMKPVQGQVPVFMGGESDDAVAFGAKHADLYMLWGEPLAGTTERIDRVRRAAEQLGRDMKFSLSLRLFVGDTDDEAWEKARDVERQIAEAQGTNKFLRAAKGDKSVGVQRAMALTDEELHDDCFWTGLTKLLGGFANSQSLVGSRDRVLESLAKYKALGIDAFLVTSGAEAAWEPELDEFMLEVKRTI